MFVLIEDIAFSSASVATSRLSDEVRDFARTGEIVAGG
jgi:hypothetical protein